MKKVTKYESEDGLVFDTSAQCIRHELLKQLVNKLDDDMYLRRDVDAEEIINWISNNKELVKDYIDE